MLGMMGNQTLLGGGRHGERLTLQSVLRKTEGREHPKARQIRGDTIKNNDNEKKKKGGVKAEVVGLRA